MTKPDPRELARQMTGDILAALPPGAVTKAAVPGAPPLVPASVMEALAARLISLEQQAARIARKAVRLAARDYDSTAPSWPPRLQPFDPVDYQLQLARRQQPPAANGHDLRLPEVPPRA
jgi:hypothetical protein